MPESLLAICSRDCLKIKVGDFANFTVQNCNDIKTAAIRLERIRQFLMQWGCTTGNAATVAHRTKNTTSGKDSVIEGQPLLLFM
jgi:hypothetical protein